MYYISSIISKINFFVFRAGNAVFGPFRTIGYNIRSLSRFNPLRMMRQSFYGVESQIRTILRLPPSNVSVKKPNLSADVPRNQRTNRWRNRSRTRVAQRAQYSQIHLTRQDSDQPTVIHIGTVIGRSTAEIVLENPTHKLVQFRFSQVDPQQYKAPMLLTYMAGEAVVQVNGVEVQHEAPLPDHATIQVDKQVYDSQLYAWDKAPIVTRVDAGWATDVGPERSENQDAIGLYQHESMYLFAIADGVGNGEYGAQVSEFAIRYLLAAFHKNVKYSLKWEDVLTKAFKYINAEVRHFARHSPTSEGTTLTAVVIKGMEAHVAHVGDSRLYHEHAGTLRQVTTDHKEQQPIEQETRVLNESAEPPRMREVLSKAIGKADTIHPDVFSIPLQPEDRLLLCTDGVTGVIPTEDITEIFPTMKAGRLAGHLVQLAVERGTKDNVSAVAIDVLKDPYVEDAWVADNEARIYAGYKSSWPMRMKRPRELYTSYPVESRNGCWVTLAVIMVIAIVAFAVIRSLGQGNNNTAAQSEIIASPSEAVVETVVTETPSPTAIPVLSATPIPPSATSLATLPPIATRIRPTPTPLIPPTPIPPTSTLRASALGAALPEAEI